MRTVVQGKQIERQIALILHAKTNRFIRNGLQFQGTTDRLGQLFERVIFQKSQYFDILPCAEFFSGRGDEASTQDIEFLRQIPVIEGLAEVEAVRFAFGDGKVMHRIVMGVVFTPVALMNGHDFVTDKTSHMVQITDDGNLLMSMFRWYRIIVVMKSDRRKRIRVS